MRLIGTIVFLSALWLLMSGVYKTLVIAFGAASVVLAVVVIRRMDAVDEDRLAIQLRAFGFLGYLIWLLGEIAKANWAVTKIILSPRMPIRQHFFAVPSSQSTDLGRVIFANSITLTPGTISVETEDKQFLVHAVGYCEDDVAALADMDARVTATEARAG